MRYSVVSEPAMGRGELFELRAFRIAPDLWCSERLTGDYSMWGKVPIARGHLGCLRGGRREKRP
jgi:hypothetical protein